MEISDLIWIDATGFHYADFPTFQQWVFGQYQGIYGDDVYLTPDTQDGQFLSILAQSFYDMAQVAAMTYNSYSPATAKGIGLSRVVKMNGLTRESPSYSTVQLTIVGVAGTVLTGAYAIDSLQQQWNIPNGTTIPGGGSTTVTAQANTLGAVQAQASTITQIGTPTRGWQTVNNSSAATAGAPVESDATLRARQAQSVAIPSQTVVDATVAGLANLPGVQQVKGYENYTKATGGGNSGSSSQVGNSIAIVIVGGTELQIAQTIQLYKTPGTQPWGDNTQAGYTTLTVYDSRGMPVAVEFEYGIQAEIGVQVTVVPGAGWSSATEALIQDAIASAVVAYGLGSDIVLNQLYQAAYLYGTPQQGTFIVSSIEIEKNSGGLASSNIQLDYNEYSVCNPATDVSIVT